MRAGRREGRNAGGLARGRVRTREGENANRGHRVVRHARSGAFAIAGLAIAIGAAGCTRESLRVALAAQQRANQVEQHIFDQQHDALCVLAYRDLAQRLVATGMDLTNARKIVLNDAWNQRDLFEFWSVQHERAKALRTVGVDAKLYADQSTVDLLYKSLTAKIDRIKQGIAAQAGKAMTEGAGKSTSEGTGVSKAGQDSRGLAKQSGEPDREGKP